MEWRVVKTQSGYEAQRGVRNRCPYIMSDFIVYETARFKTMGQARKFIKSRTNKRSTL